MRALHTNLARWLKDFNKASACLIANGFKATPTNAREGLANLTKGLVTKIPELSWVQDDLVETPDYNVPVRIYHTTPDKACPVLVFYHGGGHMAGSVTVYDPICRKLALATNHIVVSVDYRLAPECPYPNGINDAYGVLKNLWKTLDERQLNYKKQLSVTGDSGGGALVATVTGMAQFDSDIDIKYQVLIYPSLDYTMNTESMEQNANGYLLQKAKVAWYFDQYFQHNEDRKKASPLYGDFTNKLPETLMVTAEFCPLRDEGFQYVQKLQQAGVKVEHLHFEDMIHTFMNMEDLVPEACEKLYRKIGLFLANQ